MKRLIIIILVSLILIYISDSHAFNPAAHLYVAERVFQSQNLDLYYGSIAPKTVSPFSCVLKSVSIQLSGKAFGQDLSSAGTRNVARHELGHALGLGHSDDPNDLMYAAAESSEIFGDTDVLISGCDISGIDAIYPLPTYCTIPDSITCQ